MSLRNDLIKHQIFIQRIAATQSIEIEKFLKILENTAALGIASGIYGANLKNELRQSLKGMSEAMVDSLVAIMEYENEFTTKTLSKYTKEQTNSIDAAALLENNNMPINQREGGRGKKVSVAYSQFAKRKADEVAQVVSDGMISSLQRSDIAATVSGLISGLFASQAYSLAVSTVNYATALARQESTSFDDVWITALDSRVCSFCEERHGQPVSTAGLPPAHWYCRCHIEPQLT